MELLTLHEEEQLVAIRVYLKDLEDSGNLPASNCPLLQSKLQEIVFTANKLTRKCNYLLEHLKG